MTTNAAALTSIVSSTLGSPLIKVAAFSYGVRKTVQDRRDAEILRERRATPPCAEEGAVMRRLFWLSMGVTIGALVVRKLSRLAERMRPAGIAASFAAGVEDTRRVAERLRSRCPDGDAATRGHVARGRRAGRRPGATGDARMRSAEIRRRFLAHFEAAGHIVVPSVPLPYEDPNLLFVNAGMVQFVPYFVGQLQPPWRRATSVQKCIRTQDIEEVGKTTRHGTFFQMCGNFSFGDYFKSGAIQLAWDLSTNSLDDGGYGLDPERIWPTVYLDDDEAINIWRDQIGVPLERIVRRGMEDNTWDMGIPGPAGTCSELFYDRGSDYGPDGGPSVDEDRYLEFWNLVFMQYERGAVDRAQARATTRSSASCRRRTSTPASVWSGWPPSCRASTTSTRSTRPVRSSTLRPRRPECATARSRATRPVESHPDDVRLRVIADHVRTALMLIGDGVTPSNEGRGYVLRRILRRAVRSMRLLGYERPSLPLLMPVALDCMAPSYPELADEFERISMIAYGEEKTFARTVAAGTTIFDSAVSQLRSADQKMLSGSTGVPAARHLRVPHRPDARNGAGAGPDRRRGRVPRADGRAASAGQGRRAGSQGGSRQRIRAA